MELAAVLVDEAMYLDESKDYSEESERPLVRRLRQISCFSVLPSKSIIVTGHWDGVVCIWDLARKELLRRFTMDPKERVIHAALDPLSGRRLMMSSGSNTLVIDIETGEHLFKRNDRSLERWSAFMTWNADGTLLASASSHTQKRIRVCNVLSGAEWSFRRHRDFISALAAHPSEDMIASGSWDHSGAICVTKWSGEFLRWLRGHTSSVHALAATDKWIVSGCTNGALRVWSWTSDACVRVLDDFFVPRVMSQCCSLSWSADATVLASFSASRFGQTMQVWDTSSDDPKEWTFQDKQGAILDDIEPMLGVCVSKERVDDSIEADPPCTIVSACELHGRFGGGKLFVWNLPNA